ncbi:MAG: hypothetical protein II877_08935, partial [Synergistaceae bacterium]|nr:hypothetical protein [Synergistaceae bacterium]
NNLIYTLDNISSTSYGLVISRENTGLDCRNANSVTTFSITYTQPSGTDIRFAFADGDNWFTLSTAGAAVTLCTGTPSYDIVASKGNTVAQLKALTKTPAFAGKLIRVAIAVSSTTEGSKPYVKLSVNASSSSQQNSYTAYSPVFDLGNSALVSSIPFSKVTASNGTVDLLAKVYRDDDSESDWLPVSNINGSRAQAVQLRCTYYAPTIGTSSASLSQADILYYNSNYAAASGTGRIYSVTEDWYTPIKHARVNINHSPLSQSTMKVYVAFRASPSYTVSESLGTAPSGKKTYQLAHTNGIQYDSFRLYADSQRIYSGFELNCQSGRVTLTAPEGCIITCDYAYGWDKETWHEMTLDSRYALPDYTMSEYFYTDSDNKYSAAAFMIEIAGTSGTISNETLGTATGHMQTAMMKRRASQISSMQYYDSSWKTLDRSNYSLMEDLRLVRFAAPSGKSVRVSYDWASEPVQVFKVTAVFNN